MHADDLLPTSEGNNIWSLFARLRAASHDNTGHNQALWRELEARIMMVQKTARDNVTDRIRADIDYDKLRKVLALSEKHVMKVDGAALYELVKEVRKIVDAGKPNRHDTSLATAVATVLETAAQTLGNSNMGPVADQIAAALRDLKLAYVRHKEAESAKPIPPI